MLINHLKSNNQYCEFKNNNYYFKKQKLKDYIINYSNDIHLYFAMSNQYLCGAPSRHPETVNMLINSNYESDPFIKNNFRITIDQLLIIHINTNKSSSIEKKGGWYFKITL